jgi:hypothetical protein
MHPRSPSSYVGSFLAQTNSFQVGLGWTGQIEMFIDENSNTRRRNFTIRAKLGNHTNFVQAEFGTASLKILLIG